MGEVYIYDKACEDFSTTGLCGALTPTSCIHEELAGGMSAITLDHPFDPMGRWRLIQSGAILKCLCRVRTVPELEGGQVVTAIEHWTVKQTATQKQRGVFSKDKKGKRKSTLLPGTDVTVTQKGEERYKIACGKVVGWMDPAALDFALATNIPPTTDGIETAAPPWAVKYQLFRIQSVDIDTEGGSITAYAPHISYDLITNNINIKYDYPLTALQALNGCPDGCRENHEHIEGGIMGGCAVEHEFEAFTDIGDTRTSMAYENINPVEALLDPEEGFLTRWGAELVRDDFSLFFLHRAGRNRGTRIEYAKNLLGVTLNVDTEQVATAILPIGEKKDGTALYLTDDAEENGRGPIHITSVTREDGTMFDAPVAGNFVVSPKEEEGVYPFRRIHVLKCDDCTVEKGKKGVTTEIARARMIEQAKRLFEEEHIDEPKVDMTVSFVQLGDTVEYRQYKALDAVYLYDEVAVLDKLHGIEVYANVNRVKWDCLRERMEEMELGNVREGGAGIYSWQIQSLDGAKLKPGTVPADSLEDDSIPPEKLDPDLQEALQRAWDQIETARELLLGTRDWLDVVQAQTEPILQAVTDGQGAITAFQISASDIRAGLLDAEQNLAAVMLTAEELRTAMTNAQGDISTLTQTATGLSSTVSSLSGRISSVSQTASSIQSTVSTLNGQVASLIQQTADGVAVKLKNNSVSSSFEAELSSDREYSHWGGTSDNICYGINFKYNGTYKGGLFYDAISSDNNASYFINLVSKDDMTIRSKGMMHLTNNQNGYIASFTIGGAGAGSSLRASEPIVVTSDRRAKRDIAPIENEKGGAILDRLQPVQFRMNGANVLSYGFIAQDVEQSLGELGMEDIALLAKPCGEDGYYGIVYQDMIALCVDKIQRQQKQLDDLSARVARLEGNV